MSEIDDLGRATASHMAKAGDSHKRLWSLRNARFLAVEQLRLIDRQAEAVNCMIDHMLVKQLLDEHLWGEVGP